MTPDELIGQNIGSYHIEAVIGSGGMAVVYRARNTQAETVALKVLFPPLGTGSETLARFEREARTAARLRHPALVPVLEAGQAHGRAFIAMELIKGENLGERLAREGRMAEAAAADIAWQIADALYYAHGQGIVHRDIKPSNILLTDEGQALLTDFGVAQALDDPILTALTHTGYTVGTPAYMSPEQAAADRVVDGRSDLYSLGVVLYQMVTGRLPFQGGTPQMLHAHVYQPPPPPSSIANVSPGMEAVILKALSKNVSQRFQTGAAMAQALNAIGDQTGLQVPLTPSPPPLRRPIYSRLRFWITLLTVVAIGAAFWEFSDLITTFLPEPPTAVALEPTATFTATATPAPPTPTDSATPTLTPTLVTVSEPLPFPAGTLLKASGPGVFRLNANGTLQHLYDFSTFLAFGYTQEEIQTIDDNTLADLPQNGELTRLLQSPTGDLDWVANGQRWRIGRWQPVLAEAAYVNNPPSLTDAPLLAALRLNEYEDLPEGFLLKNGDNLYRLFAEGVLRRFPTTQLLLDYGYTLDTLLEIPSEVSHLYPVRGDLTPIIQAEGDEALFLLVNGQRRSIASREEAFAQGYGLEEISTVPPGFLHSFPLEDSAARFTPELPTPTSPVAAEVTPALCLQPAAEIFLGLVDSPFGEDLGCPQSLALTTAAAWQPFEQGRMLWREDLNLIYILENAENRVAIVGDKWNEGDVPFDPAIIPPPGSYQPVRGFGQVWRRAEVRASLGWALSEELGFTATIQQFDGAEVWHNPAEATFVIVFNNNTYQIITEAELGL